MALWRVLLAWVRRLEQGGEFGGFPCGEDSGVNDPLVGGAGLVIDPGLLTVLV